MALDLTSLDFSNPVFRYSGRVKEYITQNARNILVPAGDNGVREYQLTIGEQKGKRSLATESLWLMVDGNNRVISASFLLSGGNGRAPMAGTSPTILAQVKDPDARRVIENSPVLGKIGLGYSVAGPDGMMFSGGKRIWDRIDPEGKRGPGYKLGIHPDAMLKKMDGLSRDQTELREHYSGSKKARPTHGCSTSTPEEMDTIYASRLLVMGYAVDPQASPEDQIRLGEAQMKKIHAIANRNLPLAQETALLAQVEGYAALPKHRQVLNPFVLNSNNDAFQMAKHQARSDPWRQASDETSRNHARDILFPQKKLPFDPGLGKDDLKAALDKAFDEVFGAAKPSPKSPRKQFASPDFEEFSAG